MRTFIIQGALVGLCCIVVGCAPKQPPTTAFLSDYSNLEEVKGGKLRYVSPETRDYSKYIVDPVELRWAPDKRVLTDAQRTEVANYFRSAIERALTEGGCQTTDAPGVGVARIRIALTDVQKSKWYLNLHPASKVTGAGTGGASREAEVIDSVTGKQLAATVKSGRGNQFEIDTFSELDDVEDVIDKWAVEVRKQLKEWREAR